MQIDIIMAVLFAAALIIIVSLKIKEIKLSAPAFWAVSGMLLLAGFVYRCYLGYTQQGFDADIGLFKAWGKTAVDFGFGKMYDSGVYIDYPPGYMYVLSFLERLRRLFGLDPESAAYTLLIKLPAIISDVASSVILLVIGRKKLDDIKALIIMCAYYFCPALVLNSAIWGQVDSFCVTVLLLSMVLLYRQKTIPAALLYGISILLKPQMLVFVPVYLFKVIRDKNYKMLIIAPAAALGIIALCAAPFTNGFDYLWLIDKYKGTMDYYNYYSVNAYNLYSLLGMNWKGLPEGALGSFLTVVGPVIATLLSAFVYFKSEKKNVLFVCCAVIMSTTYIFTVKMHERYLFVGLIFILLTYILTRDRRFMYAFAGMSLIHYINVRYVLDLFVVKENAYDPNELIVKVISALQIAAYLYFIYVVISYYVFGNDAVKWSERKKRQKGSLFMDSKLNRTDFLSAIVITVIYSFVAFYGLGAHDTANTSWLPEDGESVVIEANADVDQICFIPGIAANGSYYRVGNNVEISYSADGVEWENQEQLGGNGVYVYEWKKHYFPGKYRYIKLTALDGSVVLNEVALKRSEREHYEVLTLISGNGKQLIDEQKAVPLYPTYYNSTYFDEIYHARTAYEHILGVTPYESTHPPLGKLFIALGIKIFGMNPFGWRFMGTFFGVLMLPALYYLLKQLFGNTFFCSVGTALFALDFMHFTQTRIATIDSYAVFFLILMFAAMTVFLKMDLEKAPFRQMLKPLALAGLFMGIGVACKWTAAYGGLGLAILFFGKLIYSCVKVHKRDNAQVKSLIHTCFRLCLYCILFFIVIPLVIYFIAFLPQTTVGGGNIFSSFINYQVGMYNYHSTLEAEHFFASAWHEWPLITKPIWFFVTTNLPGHLNVSTITSMGNPAVWWVGAPALLYTIYSAVRRRELCAVVISAGFLSVYLPWVFVPRIAFIYHYFTAVPFVVAAIIYTAMKLLRGESLSRSFITLRHTGTGNPSIIIRNYHVIMVAYLLISAVMFILFFPVISGQTTSVDYANGLEWFSTWYFA